MPQLPLPRGDEDVVIFLSLPTERLGELPMRPRYAVAAVATLFLVAVLAAPLLAAPVVSTGSTSQQSAMPSTDNFDQTSVNGTAIRQSQESLISTFGNLTDREPLFAPFKNNNGNISGRYVSFTVNPSNGTLTNYNLNVSGKQVPLFNSVTVAGFKPTTWNVSGPLFTATSENFTLYAHDNPWGSLHAVASDSTSMNISVAAGVQASPLTSTNGLVKVWNLTGNGVSGLLLVLNGTVSSSFGQPSSSQGGNFINISMQKNSIVLFRALPIAGGFPSSDEDFVLSQLANLSVEGEMTIVTVGQSTFWEASDYGSLVPSLNVTANSVIVNLTTSKSNTSGVLPLIGQSGGASSNTNGSMSWYLITMDKRTLNPANGTIQVMVNGQKLTAASSLSQLTPGTGSMYLMYNGTLSTTFAVPLPSANNPASIVIQQSGSP